ncbi:vegetative incompatibility protein HET-E-1 [Podospora conica]|nr:vegetative incompatibility protein HET-E-1 [Schizothecium conicum]
MRLLQTRNAPETTEFVDERAFPRYAILSHTWGEEEVSFKQLASPTQCVAQRGYRKVLETCALASKAGIEYAWVDTCCIDKTSSSELVEAINSMFHWYQAAAVCYVILEDLEPDAVLETALPNCRWFTRGWTLQELVAPRCEVLFFDRDWNCRGSRSGLSHLLASITLIPEELLCQTAGLSEFSVAQRMSWASGRKTTRLEDESYCLLGIFGVHMPLFYGEQGAAFRRLQEEVLRSTGDLSIFSWIASDDSENCPQFSGLLAASPHQFRTCSDIKTAREDSTARDVQVTCRGIQMGGRLIHVRLQSRQLYETILNIFSTRQKGPVGIFLRKVGGARYLRWKPGEIAEFNRVKIGGTVAIEEEEKPPSAVETRTSWLYRPGNVIVEQISLPTKLAGTLPFHSTDPVLGNRHSVLRILLQADPVPGRGFVFANFPPSHWDHHDQVFFCTERMAASWCAMSIKMVKIGMNGRREVIWSLFVACFHWNIGRTLILLANLSSLAPGVVNSFQHNLANIRFESATEARIFLNRAFDPQESIWVGKTGGTITIGPQNERLLVTLRSRMEQCPDLCVNPVNCLDISVGDAEQGKGSASHSKL